jgi:alkanesulfonate monooxygenase SsuD/methylene tetrahydromethanopterin reductase-like flavin-dependent oxidoreductase (luciferase family)
MKIGVGLPAAIPGTHKDLLLEWATRADAGPFSSLSAIDRTVYDSYEPLIVLSAVASVTQRIRLISSVLIATLHSAGALAKQAASLDAISGGRLTLGLGVGGREDDFKVMEAEIHQRGKRFEKQLATMARIWRGEPYDSTIGPIGPQPVQEGGPEVLIGGYSQAAIKRVGKENNGYIAGAWNPRQAPWFYNMARQAWQEAGRTGKPRLVACTYYGLGTNATELCRKELSQYYAFLGPMTQQMIEHTPTTPEAMREYIKLYQDMGTDELIFWPCIAEMDQLKRLEELVNA